MRSTRDEHLPKEMEYLRRSVGSPVYEVAKRTPLTYAENLSRRLGCPIYLKREDLQPTFSFKIRGAFAAVHARVQQGNCAHVMAASAGNHAQGVAVAARKLGLKATIVMPRTTPSIKVNAVRRLGAEVKLLGDSYDEAQGIARQQAGEIGATFIHPFDDPDVIAGQGTIALEVLSQCPETPQAVFIPVGGGGLVSGMAAVIKAMHPQTRVIGVEPVEAACMEAALKAGEPVTLESVGIFADGAAVRRVGDTSFALAQGLVDDIITVESDDICAAVRDTFEDTRALAEPAGALALAGLKAWLAQRSAETRPVKGPLVAINSGANVNFNRMGHVVERAIIGRGEEALIAVTIPEEPGSFLRFLNTMDAPPITEFNYRYRDAHEAQVFVGLQVEGWTMEPEATQDRLRRNGYAVQDLSHNDMARLHLRHMVGGALPSSVTEQVYRFEFPERPGALLEFLKTLAGRFNISLFHYRNHGAAYGRVLCGFMVEHGRQEEFNEFLNATGYKWIDETENPAYRQFLAAPEEVRKASGQ